MAGKRTTAKRRPEVEDEVISRLAAGETLRAICKAPVLPDFPAPPTVSLWVDSDPLFAERYARARREGLDAIGEQIIELADICREGVKTEEKQVGWSCPQCKLNVEWHAQGWRHVFGLMNTPLCEGVEKPDRVIETKVVTADMVERAKLQIDSRKWLLSKLRPDKYGDRQAIDMTVDDVTDRLSAGRARAAATPKPEDS